jgi:hypothetical protein
MWQIIRKQVRPNTDVNFFSQATNPNVSDSFKEYWVQTYSITDKSIYIGAEVSDDRLELTITMIWDSRESVDQMLNDPRCITELLEVKKAYLLENNIEEILIESSEV